MFFYVETKPAEVTDLEKFYFCPVKINLTLRVLSKRPDGFHEIISLFWKKKGIEGLTIQPNDNENIGDILDVEGIEISGENILLKTLKWARGLSPQIPPLRMSLKKEFPTGSGIGAGSGNAAALLAYLKVCYGFNIGNRQLLKVGADVPFLAGNADTALVGGLGEIICPERSLENMRCVIGFPCWKSDTSFAYRGIDHLRGEGGKDFCPEEYKSESLTVLRKLSAGEAVGLLPNDFFEVVGKNRAEYLSAFKTAEKAGALAWGLSGSGSAFFMIFEDGELSKKAISLLDREDWIIKTTELE